MFFLVYVPTMQRRLSEEEMNRLSEDFTDQLLAQGVLLEGSGLDVSQIPDEMRAGIKAQVLSMMASMQAGFVDDDNAGRKAEPGSLDVQDSDETVRMKDFLERCLKRSA